MQSFTFNEWATVATIFLSIVAILIAIWSSRSTSKSAEKQIREIKILSALQIDITIKLIEVEIQKMKAEVKKSEKECKEIDDINSASYYLGADYRNIMMRKFQERKSHIDLQIYNDCSLKLNDINKQLKDLKNKLN